MYATANLQNRYKQDYVSTASPIDLIIMLYDGCIKNLKLAKIHHEDKSMSLYLEVMEKAEDIILELVRSLNFDIPMSQDLLDLYQFMVNEMVQITYSEELERLDPIVEMLSSLREAWTEAKRSLGGNSISTQGE